MEGLGRIVLKAAELGGKSPTGCQPKHAEVAGQAPEWPSRKWPIPLHQRMTQERNAVADGANGKPRPPDDQNRRGQANK